MVEMEVRLMKLDADSDKLSWQREQETFNRVYYGDTKNLGCPYCLKSPLRFSYTFVEPDNFGIWLSCTFCNKEAHLRLKDRPPGYDEKYVLEEFQQRSEEAIRQLTKWWNTVSKDPKK